MKQPSEEFLAMERELGLDMSDWIAYLVLRVSAFRPGFRIPIKPMTAALLLECRKYPLLSGDYLRIIGMLRGNGFYGDEAGF